MALSTCKQCGGLLRRSRRSLAERVLYAEAFRCQSCRARTYRLRFNLRHARYVKCPYCHSVDLSILKKPDRIDRMHKGIVNLLQRLSGGKLYHCWFCRVQFYDTRQRFGLVRQPGGDELVKTPQGEKDIELAS